MAVVDRNADDLREPHRRSILGRSALYACAAAGGLMAAIADVVQKEEASAVVKMTSASAQFMKMTMEPIWILGLIIVLSAVLCFVFQPQGRKQSFGIGIGVIAAIMTATPFKPPPTGLPGGGQAEAAAPAQPVRWAGAEPAFVMLVDGGRKPKGKAPISQKSRVLFTLSDAPSLPMDVSISLFDPASGEQYRQTATLSRETTYHLRFEIDKVKPGAPVIYTIDVNGYRSEIKEVVMASDMQTVPLRLEDILIGIERTNGTTAQAITEQKGGFIQNLQRDLFKSYRW